MLVADPGMISGEMVEDVLKFKRLDGALVALGGQDGTAGCVEFEPSCSVESHQGIPIAGGHSNLTYRISDATGRR